MPGLLELLEAFVLVAVTGVLVSVGEGGGLKFAKSPYRVLRLLERLLDRFELVRGGRARCNASRSSYGGFGGTGGGALRGGADFRRLSLIGVEGGVVSSSEEMEPVRGRMLGPKSSSNEGKSLRRSGIDILIWLLLSRMRLAGLARLLKDALADFLGWGVSCSSSTDIADTVEATLSLLAVLTRVGVGNGRVGIVGDSTGAAGSRRENEARPLGIGVRSKRPLASSPLPLPEIMFG